MITKPAIENINDKERGFNEGNRCFLVEIRHTGETDTTAEAHLRELTGLVESLELPVAGSCIAPLRTPYPSLLLGSGKSEEIIAEARELESDIIIIDDDLSPGQQRNWERISECVVIDRQEVILEIFADRASTREASLQVALARMEYSLPRLTRAWTHLSRQRGGAKGNRGEGETQLEVDRRIVLSRIAKLKAELEQVRKQRATGRKQRVSIPLPTVALVGYTNAGKSSILNALAGSAIYAEDKLFATLDPTTRRLDLEGGRTVLMTDTVGFIRKLPHKLVDAFRATLEETVLADLLVHVVDASDPEALEQYRTTREVLEEIGASDTAQILVLNKSDLGYDEVLLHQLLARHPDAIYISAKTGRGLDLLKEAVSREIEIHFRRRSYLIPSSRYDLVALLHREARVLKEDADDSGFRVEAMTGEKIDSILGEYRTEEV
jgi:GTP-binding protein HflX